MKQKNRTWRKLVHFPPIWPDFGWVFVLYSAQRKFTSWTVVFPCPSFPPHPRKKKKKNNKRRVSGRLWRLQNSKRVLLRTILDISTKWMMKLNEQIDTNLFFQNWNCVQGWSKYFFEISKSVAQTESMCTCQGSFPWLTTLPHPLYFPTPAHLKLTLPYVWSAPYLFHYCIFCELSRLTHSSGREPRWSTWRVS